MTTTVAQDNQTAAQLHTDAIVIDGLSFYYDGSTPRLDPAKVTATNLTVAETDQGFNGAVAEILGIRAALAADSKARLVKGADDIVAAKRDGVVGIIFGLQASLPVETDLAHIQHLHDLGVRIIQLTYNDRTYSGDGCLEPVDGGMSRFGQRMITEMARLGVALDLSHVGRRTSLDAIAASPKPPMFSHANPAALTGNPRNLTDNPRNLTDEQIKAIGERGGMIGCCSWSPLCWKNRRGVTPTVGDFIDHIDYVVNLIGVDHVGIATDSGCTVNQAWLDRHHQEFNGAFPQIAGDYDAQVGGSSQPIGAEKGIGDLTPITAGLLERGYSEGDVRKIIGDNFLRHFRQAWSAT